MIYKVKHLNVGGSINALLYSFINNEHLIIEKPVLPYELEMFKFPINPELLGFNKDVGVTSMQVWDRLSFILSMAGLLFLTTPECNVTIGEKRSTIVTSGNQKITLEYESLLRIDKEVTNDCFIYDWFDVRSLHLNNKKSIYDYTDDFVKEICFYESQRSSVNRGHKDMVAISVVNQRDLDSVDSSHIYSKLKSLSMMKSAGLTGSSNGYSKTGKKLYKPIEIVHAERVIREIVKPSVSMADISKMKVNKKDLTWRLTQNLFKVKNHFT